MPLIGEIAFLLDSYWLVSFLLLTIDHDYEGLINLILKVGPHNTYPEHAHAAEEGYHFLAGDIFLEIFTLKCLKMKQGDRDDEDVCNFVDDDQRLS